MRRLSSEGKMAATMTALVLGGASGEKSYREDSKDDLVAFEAAGNVLEQRLLNHDGILSLLPDEPMSKGPETVAGRGYGIESFCELFNARQLLALTTFARLVGEAHAEMLRERLDAEYAKAVATYLGIVVDRQATRTSMGSFWDAGGGTVQQLLARQALPMVWDFAESAPLEEASGGISTNISTLVDAIKQQSFASTPGKALARDARRTDETNADCVVTDPPYYDAINYADLSDFFYVWLKRAVGEIHPDLLGLPLTPKREQAIMNPHAPDLVGGKNRQEKARHQYVRAMEDSFKAIAASLEAEGSSSVVFAHTDPDAWATLIEGLLSAGLVAQATWPIDGSVEKVGSSAVGLDKSEI